MITDRTGVLTTQAGTQQIREKRVRYAEPASHWSNDCNCNALIGQGGHRGPRQAGGAGVLEMRPYVLLNFLRSIYYFGNKHFPKTSINVDMKD